MPSLEVWANFYVIVGSAAGALIGLQFVVMTLIAQNPRQSSAIAHATGAFLSPTIVHFSTVLTLSALTAAPWRDLAPLATIWALAGVCGVAYAAVVAWRMSKARDLYQAELEDAVFYVALPAIAYGVVAGSAFASLAHWPHTAYTAAAGVLMLLLIGIRNAWDNISFLVLSRAGQPRPAQASASDVPDEMEV